MITEKPIKKLIEDHFKGSEFFLVDLKIRTGNQISVFIDGDHRVNIDVCRELSHFLEENLDRESEDFDLTVSSAGADRPLKLPRQYKKNIGNELELITKKGEKITGIVLNADDEAVEIELQPEKKTRKEQEKIVTFIKFDEIKSAKEVISFKK
ncbi:MAG: ribosome assembly cofactor RimP [Bacteroidota bacterium]